MHLKSYILLVKCRPTSLDAEFLGHALFTLHALPVSNFAGHTMLFSFQSLLILLPGLSFVFLYFTLFIWLIICVSLLVPVHLVASATCEIELSFGF